MLSPEQKVARTVPHLLQEIPGRPGSFLVQPGVEVKWGGQIVDTASREVTLDVFDPDLTGLPFHRSASFLAIPPEIRWWFLLRNPAVTGPLIQFFSALCRLAGRGNPKPRLNQPVVPDPTLLGRRYVSWKIESPTIQTSVPDLSLLLSVVDYLNAKFGIRVKWLDDEGDWLVPPTLFIWASYPTAPAFAGTTVRKQRSFKRFLARRRTLMQIASPRQRMKLDDYRKMLQVWDLHEGWTDILSKGYDPEKAVSLDAAASRIGVHPRFYYRAFKLVTGESYSIAGWLRLFGLFWEGHWQFHTYKSRGTGRRSKTREEAEQKAEHEAVSRFYQLVSKGIAIPQAIAETRLDVFCPAETLEKLADPANYLDIFSVAQNLATQ